MRSSSAIVKRLSGSQERRDCVFSSVNGFVDCEMLVGAHTDGCVCVEDGHVIAVMAQ